MILKRKKNHGKKLEWHRSNYEDKRGRERDIKENNEEAREREMGGEQANWADEHVT